VAYQKAPTPMIQFCSSWQNFNWHSSSCCPSLYDTWTFCMFFLLIEVTYCMHSDCNWSRTSDQGAYNSGKPGNSGKLGIFLILENSGKFEIYSGNVWKSSGRFRWSNLKPTTSRHVSVRLQWYLWTAGSGLLDFSGQNTFRWWNCGRTPTLTFIGWHLQLELGRLQLSYWCLCWWVVTFHSIAFCQHFWREPVCYMTVFLGHRFVCVIILSNSSIDWLGDTVTGMGGVSHHAS